MKNSVKPSTIYVREATLRDCRRVAEIGVEAFHDMPLVNVLFPFANTHPDHWLPGRIRYMKSTALDPRSRLMVACDCHTKQILAYGLWTRFGSDAHALRIQREKERNPLLTLERAITSTLNQIIDWWPWRGQWEIDREGVRKAERIREYIDRNWFTEKGRTEWWYLESLATDKRFRGRGAAGALVDWGVEMARREGVVAGLEATPAGKPVYEKRGFKQEGEDVNVIEGVEMFAMMVLEPGR